MIRIIFSLVLLVTLTLISCTPYAVSTKDNPSCKTVVQGIFHAPISVKNFDPDERPLMISKKNGVQRIEAGRVISQDSNGIVFRRKKVGVAGGGTDRLYKYSEIMCLLDSSNQVVYGSIAACKLPQWSMEVRLSPLSIGAGTDEVVVVMKADEEYSYCVEPGKYAITEIKFMLNGDIDVNSSKTNLMVDIQKGRVNYLGDVILDSDEKTTDTWIIPCRIDERKSDGAAAAMFGIAGFLVNRLATGSEAQHTLLYKAGILPIGAVSSPIVMVK